MSLQSNVYINGVLQEGAELTSFDLSTTIRTGDNSFVYTPLLYNSLYAWWVDIVDTDTDTTFPGDIWFFVTQNGLGNETIYDLGDGIYLDGIVYINGFEIPIGSGIVRHGLVYLDNEKDSWQFIDGEWQWTDLPDVKGGGRYRNSVFVFGIDANGLGNISIGE